MYWMYYNWDSQKDLTLYMHHSKRVACCGSWEACSNPQKQQKGETGSKQQPLINREAAEGQSGRHVAATHLREHPFKDFSNTDVHLGLHALPQLYWVIVGERDLEVALVAHVCPHEVLHDNTEAVCSKIMSQGVGKEGMQHFRIAHHKPSWRLGTQGL
jgi:hypothetical protein